MLYKTINKTLPSKPDSAKRICWGIWLSALLCWIHACSECECSAHEESKAPSKATRFTYGWTSFGSVLDAFVSFIVRGSLSLLLCMNSTRRHSYYEQMKRETWNTARREYHTYLRIFLWRLGLALPPTAFTFSRLSPPNPQSYSTTPWPSSVSTFVSVTTVNALEMRLDSRYCLCGLEERNRLEKLRMAPLLSSLISSSYPVKWRLDRCA